MTAVQDFGLLRQAIARLVNASTNLRVLAMNAKLAEKGNAATSGVAKAAKPLQALQGRAEPKPL
jgi:hypothetical protein